MLPVVAPAGFGALTTNWSRELVGQAHVLCERAGLAYELGSLTAFATLCFKQIAADFTPGRDGATLDFQVRRILDRRRTPEMVPQQVKGVEEPKEVMA